MSARNINIKRLPALGLSSLLVVAAVVPMMLNHHAGAADLTQVLVRFDRMKVSTATTGTVCAKPATAATEATVKVTFPTGYTLGTAGDFTVNTTNTAWPATATAWLGIGTASGVSGQDVTFPSSDLVVGTLYCFNWDSSAAVSVKAGATANNTGLVTTEATGPSTIDSSIFSTASVSDDQILVTATVPQTFSFALSGNTDAFGVLNQGIVNVGTTPRTATVDTNAKNGWYVWARDTQVGIHSAAAAVTVASTTPGVNSTLSAGTEGYNTGVTSSQVSGTGTISVATPFVGGSLGKGNGLNTNLQTVASSNGTANTAVLTLTNNVAISSITAAATDYTDTITVVGAGLF